MELITQPASTLEQDVYTYFCNTPRRFPPKYLYDDKGSELFEQICDTPEYYLTRTERQLLKDGADAIVSTSKPNHIIEFGSGNSYKTRILLDSCQRQRQFCTYWPIDVCKEIVDTTSREFKREYPWLNIQPLIGDYHAYLDRTHFSAGRKLALFLGSTIGNLEEHDAIHLLTEMRQLLGKDDLLLLGVDRVKDVSVIEAAYNDQAGLTAKFNMNLLDVLNRDLDADFQHENFSRRATYNHEKNRVESYLESKVEHSVYFKRLDLTVNLLSDEAILTEISRKFTLEGLQHLAASSGYQIIDHFSPDNNYFSLLLMQPQCTD